MSSNVNQLPAVKGSDATSYLSEYDVGPSGTIVKFDGKVGKFVRTLDDTEVPEGTVLTCIYTETQAGWIKFNGKGNPPDRHMGSIFSGYVPPRREELGDQDQDLWEKDLSGKPADPWQHQIMLPLLSAGDDGEKFIFTTTSLTGRRAVSNLLNHCNRMAGKEPDYYPVIQLKTSGFQHRDDRVGWVKTPAFAVIGKVPKNAAEDRKMSLKDDMEDEIPPFE